MPTFANWCGEEITKDTWLDILREERVLKIKKEPSGTFVLKEQCDRYFFVRLTKEQMLELAEEIKALANS